MHSRATASKIIWRWLTTGEFPGRMLAAVDRDRAFITELAYGVVRWKRLLEWMLRQTIRRLPPPRIKAFVLTALYELFMMKNAAAYAVLNETVAAVKRSASLTQANFVNAVLRQALRDRAKLNAAIGRQKPGIRFSHPDLLVNRWINNYGEARTLRLVEWNNSRPDVIIRLNTLVPEHRLNVFPPGRANPAEPRPPPDGRAPSPLVCQASSAGAPLSIGRLGREAAPCPFEIRPEHKYFLKVPHGIKVEDLPGYRAGLFLVIDPFALNAVELLAPEPGEAVLDACAAPGGKTFLIAERMRAQGSLLAVDRDERRLHTLKTNLARLGISDFVTVLKQDIGDWPCRSRRESGGRQAKFDRILADVPCTNTGVIRRKPDVRWNFNLPKLRWLAGVQKQILSSLAGLLKSGGVLVYSTCSLEPEENEMLTAAWLAENPGFYLREKRHFFPPESNTDGGYAAAIVKHAGSEAG